MLCPDYECQAESLRDLSPDEPADVTQIPETDHPVVWEPIQSCEACGLVFANGKLDGWAPLLLRLGHFQPSQGKNVFEAV